MKEKKEKNEKTIPFHWYLTKKAEEALEAKMIIDIVTGIISIAIFIYLTKKDQD